MMLLPSRNHDEVCGSSTAAVVSLHGFFYVLVVHTLNANKTLTGFTRYSDGDAESVREAGV